MLRSDYCSLYEKSEKQLSILGECPYDQVTAAFDSNNITISVHESHACASIAEP